jgi:very-short-patch-repair endonuclease
MICSICGYTNDSNRSFAKHIKKHNISIKEYYDKFLKTETDGICICGKKTNFKNIVKGYFRYCSLKCSANSEKTIKIRKETTKNRYGDENYRNVEASKNVWNSKSAEEVNDIVDKRRQTKAILYGNEKFNNREKSIETCKNRYGVNHFTNRDLAKKTCLEKYGVDNPFAAEQVKNDIKQHWESLGVTHPMHLKSIKNKVTKNRLLHYKNNLINFIGDQFEVLDYLGENDIHLKCKECNKDFWIQKQLILFRLENKITPCLHCVKYGSISNNENNLLSYIKTIYSGEIIENSRKIIEPYELDIYLPELKLAFEYDGLYWHNENFVNNSYHLNKTELCEKLGIQLIHIYEDDWIYNNSIVKSRILNLLNKVTRKIYARECVVKEVSSIESNNFLKDNHLQGICNAKIRLGLWYDEELVSLMTFSGYRKNLGKVKETNCYELLRFCSKLETVVVGGSNKLFKHFINTYSPDKVISYADRSWSSLLKSNVYLKMGFNFIRNTDINYYYILRDRRVNRFKYRKSELIKEGFDSKKSEKTIMLERKIYRIYNSGNLLFEWTKTD